jgi:hypothetical protein
METYLMHRVAAIATTPCSNPGASRGWQVSGAVAPAPSCVSQGTLVPSCGDSAFRPALIRTHRGFMSGMRITAPGADVHTYDFSSTTVPGPRTWSPPA